jgi:hypothetical protein
MGNMSASCEALTDGVDLAGSATILAPAIDHISAPPVLVSYGSGDGQSGGRSSGDLIETVRPLINREC